MRIVIDTNVVASAVFFGGRPRELLEKLILNDLEAFVSPEIVEEYRETFDYLRNQYPLRKVSIPLTRIVSACTMIEPKTNLKVCRDPDDDKFIECAIDSKSLYVVSGDKDLLTIKHYQNVEIVTVSEFFRRVYME